MRKRPWSRHGFWSFFEDFSNDRSKWLSVGGFAFFEKNDGMLLIVHHLEEYDIGRASRLFSCLSESPA
jgi:hypothetical protein